MSVKYTYAAHYQCLTTSTTHIHAQVEREQATSQHHPILAGLQRHVGVCEVEQYYSLCHYGAP